jgi:hypothetical protein
MSESHGVNETLIACLTGTVPITAKAWLMLEDKFANLLGELELSTIRAVWDRLGKMAQEDAKLAFSKDSDPILSHERKKHWFPGVDAACAIEATKLAEICPAFRYKPTICGRHGDDLGDTPMVVTVPPFSYQGDQAVAKCHEENFPQSFEVLCLKYGTNFCTMLRRGISNMCNLVRLKDGEWTPENARGLASMYFCTARAVCNLVSITLECDYGMDCNTIWLNSPGDAYGTNSKFHYAPADPCWPVMQAAADGVTAVGPSKSQARAMGIFMRQDVGRLTLMESIEDAEKRYAI